MISPAFALPALTDDEFTTAKCIVATQGAYTVATLRQSGASLEHAKSELDKEFYQLSQYFGNKDFLRAVYRTWDSALRDIYQMDDTSVQHPDFTHDMTRQMLDMCMNALEFGQRGVQ